MAVSDTTSECLRLRRTDTVPGDASVVHVDQLDDATFDDVHRATTDAAGELPPTSTLSAGDIVVYTDYLRVESA